MPEINVTSCEQIGGYEYLSLITVDEIINCPAILTNSNANQFTSSPEIETIDAVHIGDSIKVSAKPRRTKSGILYDIKASFEIASQSPLLDDFLHNRLHKKIVFITKKNFEQQKLYGSKLHPLRYLFEEIDGQKPEDGQKVRITISGKIVQKPVYIVD